VPVRFPKPFGAAPTTVNSWFGSAVPKGYSVLIPAAWTVPPPIVANEVNNAKQESNNSEERSIPFNSSRLRRNCPLRRDPDFLWS